MAVSEGDMNREQLGQLIDGKSDQEIEGLVTDLGAEELLGQVFEGMRQAFIPERAAGQNAVVQWEITSGDQAIPYGFSVQDGKASVTKGPVESPRVTLGLSLADFLRFISGRLDGMQAFMSGKLRLSGDLMFAQAMQAWFET